jgi:CheY-like chemotaxis protein
VTGDQPAPPQPEEDTSGGAETILLVEDEEVVRLAAQGMLEHLGYRVLTAHDGRSALRVSEGFRGTIHLLMTDVVMPGMNGRELAETLGRIRPDMRVLFTSGYTDDVIVHHGVLDAGVSFIAKPFDNSELARGIRKALDD